VRSPPSGEIDFTGWLQKGCTVQKKLDIQGGAGVMSLGNDEANSDFAPLANVKYKDIEHPGAGGTRVDECIRRHKMTSHPG